jgi:hypothetical protein
MAAGLGVEATRRAALDALPQVARAERTRSSSRRSSRASAAGAARSPGRTLADHRRASGIDARLVVVGMVSNGFSIADPNDSGMLDVVDMDTATPQLVSDFARGAV